jgi:multicomponent Na+:H+ antiporter subunit D
MLFIPFLVPVISGIILIITKNMPRKPRCYFVLFVLAATLASSIASAFLNEQFTLLSLGDLLQISFATDTLARIFSVLASSVFLICGIFAFDYMKGERSESTFFGFFVIVLGVLNALAYASNLITMYLCFEFVTLVSVPLVLHNMDKKAINAGLKYLFYSIVGAFIGLFGIIIIYGYSSGVFIAGGNIGESSLNENSGLLLVGIVLTVIGFGTKAGMFPMHAWLTSAHPAAPSPASAVLSGLIAKAGIIAVIRIIYFVAGPSLIRGTWVQFAWSSIALLTVLMGSVLAFTEKQLKKRLAFSSISQISYIMLGLSMLTPDALTGSVLHMIFHAAIKSGLFLAAGAIIKQTGTTYTDGINGIGKKMPYTVMCWTFYSLALIGIPPFSGFVSKWYLAIGSLNSGLSIINWLAPAILLISAALTAGYLLPLIINGYFHSGSDNESIYERNEASKLMVAPMAVLAVAVLMLGLCSSYLIEIITEITGAAL